MHVNGRADVAGAYRKRFIEAGSAADPGDRVHLGEGAGRGGIEASHPWCTRGPARGAELEAAPEAPGVGRRARGGDGLAPGVVAAGVGQGAVGAREPDERAQGVEQGPGDGRPGPQREPAARAVEQGPCRARRAAADRRADLGHRVRPVEVGVRVGRHRGRGGEDAGAEARGVGGEPAPYVVVDRVSVGRGAVDVVRDAVGDVVQPVVGEVGPDAGRGPGVGRPAQGVVAGAGHAAGRS